MKNLSWFRQIGLLAIITLVCACGSSSDEDSVEYVAIGASDAVGIGASPLTNGYVYRIEDGLQDCGANISLDNLGIPGAGIREMKNVEVPVAEEIEPDFITIVAGANDLTQGTSVEEFEEDFRKTVEDLMSNTDAYIVVSNLPDLTQFPRYQSEPDSDVTIQRINAYNNSILSVANQFGTPVVDLFSQPALNFLFSDDGFHPSDEGHQLVANLFLEILKPVFCKP